MKKAKILILMQILILVSIIAVPAFTTQVHASASGRVCMAAAGATTCPALPPILSASPNGTRLRVGIVISNSTAINGFDITVRTNRTVLRPIAVDISQTILVSPASVVVECIDGALVAGPTCLPTDVLGTVHLSLSGAAGLLSTASSGLLFTAIYNITGLGPDAPLTFQTGCSGTSVSGGTCVTITNGGSAAVPEAVQTASFGNVPVVPSFALNANPPALSIVQGHFAASEIIATSLNNFTGLVSLNTTVSPSGPLVTLGSSSLLLPPNGLNTTALDVNLPATVAIGSYIVTVSASSRVLTAVTVVQVTVTGPSPPPDFQFSANPVFVSIPQGSSANTTMTATSIGGFSGSIFITLGSISPLSQFTPILQWGNTITLSSGGTGHALLIIDTFSATPAGNYTVTMIGTSGSISHSLTVIVAVTTAPGFSISVPPEIVLVPTGFSNSTRVTVSSNLLFNGTVTLSTASSPPAPSATLSRTVFTLGPNQNVNTTITFFAGNGTLPGLYFIGVTGRSGLLTRSISVAVKVVSISPPAPDFAISTSPSFQTVQAGFNASYTITLTSLNGFSANINLTATITPSTLNQPLVRLIPVFVSVPPGGVMTVTLLAITSGLTPGQFYTIEVTAIGQGQVHFTNVSLQVLAPPDEPPTASFTFTPSNPVVGQTVAFDGSGSQDPDGAVVSWSWSFGDGFISFGEFTSHTYTSPGSYSVTLTVSDNSGLTSFRSMSVSVRPRPAHDVGIVEVFLQPTRVVSTQTVSIQVELINLGSSNETVSVTGYANGRPVQTVRGIFLLACGPTPFCFSNFYVQVLWDTSGVAPGNYTISASVSLALGELDPTPADNSATDGTVTVLPAPVITLSPSGGVDGTKVLVQGSGFPVQQQFGFTPISVVYVNFDNMSIGFTFTHNGTFTFTFDVPLSEPGTHGVFAFDPYSGAHASAIFTVQPTPTGSLSVSIDMGTIYFPGDTATAYVLTTFNGAPVGPQNVQLQVILFKPDGTNLTLTAARVGTGLFKATYAIPSSGAVLGTYLVVARAHQPGPVDASSLVSFEVKLTWLNSNGGKITVGATTLAGVVGLAAVAWKKGYLRRKNNEEPESALPF